ncbi:UNVERIFIED_CONTAM: putative magnesium transporter NIPA6 [Sesamum calycinum]|uniref:Probable magnesium transporter n=1 Tax=Sesamum calycinum TaxID=2727403 RepID=A0AAW2PK36_9LAMI
MGVSDNTRGLVLAMLSSLFIGTSFILKKKGLRQAAAAGTRAGVGGYTYLLEPLWWAGMITMIVGEVANFVAYIYAPAVLVTPLGALSIIVSAVLAHFLLKERLRQMGVLGCVSCIVGSVVIVIHAPQEQTPSSVQEVWDLATQPAFLIYVAATLSMVLVLIAFSASLWADKCTGLPRNLFLNGCDYGCKHKGNRDSNKTYFGGDQSIWIRSDLVFPFSCSNLCDNTVKLSEQESFSYLSLNHVSQHFLQALDTFNAAIVSPIYYVMFTTLTITASAIMFKDWSGQNLSSITSEICGFITVLTGTVILHMTREEEPTATTGIPKGAITWYDGDPSKALQEAPFITLDNSDYFD